MSSNSLTQRQIAILLTGGSFGFDGRGFVNETEELTAWTTHRNTMLAVSRDRRPAAYFRFELCEETPQWIRDAETLFRRGLIFKLPTSVAECLTLSAAQPADLHEQFETPAGVRALALDPPVLEGMLREFGHAAAWHGAKDRPALADKYRRIGASIRAVLRENLQVMSTGEKLCK